MPVYNNDIDLKSLFGNLYDIISINKKYSNQDFESMLFGQNQKY